jgi:pyruvate/2-oxoacid:ferredoxin oxidoreductase alpha subunit
MACRQTGFALIASGSVQEAQDFAAIAHSATLAARIPFLHFFDGFRTSHELAKIAPLADEDLRALIDDRDPLQHDREAGPGTLQTPPRSRQPPGGAAVRDLSAARGVASAGDPRSLTRLRSPPLSWVNGER